MRRELEILDELLTEHGESRSAQAVRAAREGTDADRRAFLLSNELWGGAGSIADQAGVGRGRKARMAIESALVSLGREQMRQNVVNDRTAMWVDAFSSWQGDDV